MVLTATLYQQPEKKPFDPTYCWMKLKGKPKWQNLVDDLKNDKRLKKNDGQAPNNSLDWMTKRKKL